VEKMNLLLGPEKLTTRQYWRFDRTVISDNFKSWSHNQLTYSFGWRCFWNRMLLTWLVLLATVDKAMQEIQAEKRINLFTWRDKWKRQEIIKTIWKLQG
jgi:hypothetical protein